MKRYYVDNYLGNRARLGPECVKNYMKKHRITIEEFCYFAEITPKDLYDFMKEDVCNMGLHVQSNIWFFFHKRYTKKTIKKSKEYVKRFMEYISKDEKMPENFDFWNHPTKHAQHIRESKQRYIKRKMKAKARSRF